MQRTTTELAALAIGAETTRSTCGATTTPVDDAFAELVAAFDEPLRCESRQSPHRCRLGARWLAVPHDDAVVAMSRYAPSIRIAGCDASGGWSPDVATWGVRTAADAPRQRAASTGSGHCKVRAAHGGLGTTHVVARDSGNTGIANGKRQ